MITVLPETQGNVLAMRASAKLTKVDIETFRNRAEELMRQHGKIRVLLELTDFHGWEVGAAWEDLKLGMARRDQFERCAIVGDRKWEEWLIELSQPFFNVRYFDESERQRAIAWLNPPVEEVSRRGMSEFIADSANFIRRHPLTSAAAAFGLFLVAGSLARR